MNAAWRARYGNAFTTFLEEQPATLPAIPDVIGSALLEQFRAAGDVHIDARQRMLVLMALAYLGAVAAGVNFYWTVSDTPLAAAMKSRPMLAFSFRAVALGSLVALAAVVAIALPTTWSIAIDAFNARRWCMLGANRRALRLCIRRLRVAGRRNDRDRSSLGGDAWDITGDWPAPAEWPPLAIRWTMGSVTFALLLCRLAASATAAIQVIRESDFSRFRSGWFRFPSVALAVSTLHDRGPVGVA